MYVKRQSLVAYDVHVLHAGCHHLQQNLLQHVLLGGLQVHCKHIISLRASYLPRFLAHCAEKQRRHAASFVTPACRDPAFSFLLSLSAGLRLHTISQLLQAFACCKSIAAYTAQPSVLHSQRLTADALLSRLTKPLSCPADQGFTHLTEKCSMLLMQFDNFGFGS